MKLIISTIAAFGLVSSIQALSIRDTKSGCGSALPEGLVPGKSKNLTLSSNSGTPTRKYRLHLPANYDGTKKLPVILSFHGRTQDAKYQEKLSQFSNASYGFEGISVYPQGVNFITDDGKEVPQWQGDPDADPKISDVKFTLELIDHLESTFCIDKSRIYAAGKSNGGGFTGLLACDPVASTRIAAFAPVSGAFYLNKTTQQLPDCKPGRLPIPIADFHGIEDKTIKYKGALNSRKNANSTNIPAYVNAWADRDHSKADQNVTSTLCSGKKSVTKYTWGDETVVHYAYKNLEHDWPSSFFNLDTDDKTSLLTCKDAEATSLILDWFARWTL
ncbi:feruloyl esterase [Parastagonospora nodorum]|nr:feruloyl esterase [Parastagonospora nodorum]KAH4068354.1 feruloyl esterase [Parastagonospora nodorum]KAH4078321.1 feruloyl esterase [Parastagonospora nodorum]KAH4127048.1 feruloyl esterase [Parastagonospora nodorum]KAH4192085.1 feruloyl esterase [Parastagonospora nodorum]